MAEQLAVMRHVRFGVDDRGQACVHFAAYITESGAADQYLYGEDALRFAEDYGVDDVAKLEGRTCWAEVTASMIRYDRAWKGK